MTENTPNSIPHFAFDSPFEVVYRNNSTSTPVKPHTHNALEIYFTLNDLPDVLLNDTVSGVSRNSLIIIPSYCVHQLYHQKDTVYERYIITISTSWLQRVLGEDMELLPYASYSAEPEIIRLSDEASLTLQALLAQYISSFSNSPESSGQAGASVDATLTVYTSGHTSANNASPSAGISVSAPAVPSLGAYAVFFSLLEKLNTCIIEGNKNGVGELRTISGSQKKVNEVIGFINQNITSPLTLEDISDHFHLNKDYLGRMFKEHVHSTVGHYIALQKTSLAQAMLSDGLSVAEVAEKLGFSSYAYFFRFFKKMTGISPSHYRKEHI